MHKIDVRKKNWGNQYETSQVKVQVEPHSTSRLSSSVPLFPKFSCSLVPLFPHSPCSSCFPVPFVPLVPLFPCSPCSAFPFFPCSLCSPVPLVPLLPFSLVSLVPPVPPFPLYPCFLCFAVPLFPCSPCSSVLLVPLFLLFPLLLCSRLSPSSPVPLVPLFPLFRCSPCSPCFPVPFVPLFPLFPLFPCSPCSPYSPVPLVPPVPNCLAWEFTAHYACNAEMNLKSTSTNAFNFRIINSLMASWGYAWPGLTESDKLEFWHVGFWGKVMEREQSRMSVVTTAVRFILNCTPWRARS